MRLVTFTAAEKRRLGCQVEDTVVDLQAGYLAYLASKNPSAVQKDAILNDLQLSDMMAFLRAGDPALEAARMALDFVQQLPPGERSVGETEHQIRFNCDDVKLEAPIPVPRRIIGVEMNYRSNLEEIRDHLINRLNIDVPEWPALDHPWTFPKFPNCVIGPGEPIVYPELTTQLDGEVELAVVIGKQTNRISSREAPGCVAGYTIMNDISARDIEFTLAPDINHRLFTLGKNAETFAPMGPCLVTSDEVPEPHNLAMEMRFNDRVIQTSNTKHALKSVYELISFYSELFVLEPGDIVMTGSPGHSGVFHEPPIFLQRGDTVTVAIENLGTLTNPVVGPTRA